MNLLENLSIQSNRILLQNKYVSIVISTFNNIYTLESFYNKLHKKNAARCGLYLLLKELLQRGLVSEETILYVSEISPSNGGRRNTEAYTKLIHIYENIGFSIESGDIENKNIVMSSSMSNLIETLTPLCSHIIAGGTKKNKRTRRKTSRRRTIRKTK